MQSSLQQSLLPILFFCLFSETSLAITEEWQLERQKGQVKIYSRQTESGYKEIKAQTTVKSSPVALLLLLDDISRAPEWISENIEVKILSAPDKHERIVQSYFSAPWPIKDRDMITHSTTSIDKSGVVIDISNKGEEFPDENDYVRMREVSGRWHATMVSDQICNISYQGSGNPSGNIPRWLANKVIINSTFETFLNLSEIILEGQYQVPEITP
jgi:hypothetical protein